MLVCYRLGVTVFLTSATVVLNHFTQGSQIQTYNFVKEPH